MFYNGLTPWNAPLKLKDCIAGPIPGSLKKYQPDLEYAVLDIGHITLDKYSAEADNLMIPIIELEQVCEVNTMLADNVERWKQNFKREGIEEGIEKGIGIGIEEGARKKQKEFLLFLLKADSNPLSPQTLERIKTASTEELDQWIKKLFNRESIECLE